jgi:metal-dependent amidase/aminoacylase/carboxypeptidase family protein
VPTDPALSEQPPELTTWQRDPHAYPELGFEQLAAARSYWLLLVAQELPLE